MTKSAFLEKQNENSVLMEHLKDSKIVFPKVGRMDHTYFIWLYLSKEQSYWQNWHIFVKLLNLGPWLECKRNDGATENFCLTLGFC